MDKLSTSKSKTSKITSQVVEQNNNTKDTDHTYKKNNCVPVIDEIVPTTGVNNINESEQNIHCPNCKRVFTWNETGRTSRLLGICCRYCFHVFSTGTHENKVDTKIQTVPKAAAKKKRTRVQKDLKRPKIVHVDISSDVELDVPSFTSDLRENNARLQPKYGPPFNIHLHKETNVMSKPEVAEPLNNQILLQHLTSRSQITNPFSSLEIVQVMPLRADVSLPILTPSPYLTINQGTVIEPTISNQIPQLSQSHLNQMFMQLIPSQPLVKEPINTIKIDDSDDECIYGKETNFAILNKSNDFDKVSDIERRVIIVDDGCEERQVKEEIVWLEEAKEVSIKSNTPYPVAVSCSLNRPILVDLQENCDNDGSVDLTNDYSPEIICNDSMSDDSNHDNHDGANEGEHDDVNDNEFLRIEAVTTLSKEQFSTLNNDALLTGYEKDRHQLEKKQNNFGSEFLKFLEMDSNSNDDRMNVNKFKKKPPSHVHSYLPYPNLLRKLMLRTNEIEIQARFLCAIAPLKVIALSVAWGLPINDVKTCLSCYKMSRLDAKHLATVVSDRQILRCGYCVSTSCEIKVSTLNLKCSKLEPFVEIIDDSNDVEGSSKKADSFIDVEGSSQKADSSIDVKGSSQKADSSIDVEGSSQKAVTDSCMSATNFVDNLSKAYVESESWRSFGCNVPERAKYFQPGEMIYIIYACNDCLPIDVSVSKYASVQSRDINFKCLVCGALRPAANAVMLR